jgi:hypothetical protein
VYHYEFYADPVLTVLLASADSVAPGPDTLQEWDVPVILTYGEDYYWRVRGTDEHEEGQWSETAGFWILEPAAEYLCGDVNDDEAVNVGDAVFLINYVFKGGAAPDPECVGDTNGDGSANVGDAVYVINYVFKGGPEPMEGCCL